MPEDKAADKLENISKSEGKTKEIKGNYEVVLESDQTLVGSHIKEEESTEESSASSGKTKVPFTQKVDYMVYIIIIGFILTLALGFLSFAEYQLVHEKYIAEQNSQAQKELSQAVANSKVKLTKIRNKLGSYKANDFNENLSSIANDIYPGAELEIVTLPFEALKVTDNPHQGYAFLSFLAQLTAFDSNSEFSKFDLIKPGTEYESLILMRYLKADKENKTDEFIVVLRLPTKFITDTFANIKLTQGDLQIKQGNSYNLYGKLSQSYPLKAQLDIANTTWKAIYSYSIKELAFSINSFLMVIIYASIAISALLFTSLVFVRRLKKFISSRKLSSMQRGNSALSNDKALSNLGHQTALVVDDAAKTNNENVADQNPLDEQIVTQHGIRGLVGQQITATSMQLLGQAIAQELDHLGLEKVTVGRDNRESSEELTQALIRGLKTSLIEIYDIGVVSSPVCFFHAAEKTQNNAIMVTAGSMSSEYNGLKVLISNEYYTQAQLKTLFIEAGKELLSDELGKVIASNANVTSEYNSHLRKIFKFKRKLRVVIDTCHSSSGNSIKRLLTDLGCIVFQVRNEPSETFEGQLPNPSKPDSLQQLIEAVKNQKGDIGFFINSDATALGVISAQGKIIWPDRVMMLLAKQILAHQKGAKILYDVKSSSSLHDWILEYEGEPDLCPSGYINLQERMKMNQAFLAGEFTGHYFFKENHKTHDDAIFNLLKVMQAICLSDNAVFETLPEKISTPEILIPVQPGQLEGIMSKLMVQKDELGTMGIITLDGIRVEYEDGWGLVRASHTSNALSLRFEADNHVALQRIAEKFKSFVLSVVFVKFPF